MGTTNQVNYERTKDSVKISGDPASVKPLIKDEQRREWVKLLASLPFIWFSRYTGLSFLLEKIKTIRSG